jgi:hypothetical protein
VSRPVAGATNARRIRTTEERPLEPGEAARPGTTRRKPGKARGQHQKRPRQCSAFEMAFALVLSLDRLLVPQSAPGWQLPLGGMLPSSSSRSQAVAWAEIAILERAAIGSLAFRLAFGRQNGYERPKFRCSTPNNAPPSLPYNSALRVNHAPNPHASLFPLLGGGVPRGLCRRRVVGSPHSYPSLHRVARSIPSLQAPAR